MRITQPRLYACFEYARWRIRFFPRKHKKYSQHFARYNSENIDSLTDQKAN